MEIPKVLLGTSPFIAAGQFGPRAMDYYKRFFNRPEIIAKIIRRAYGLGVTGIQLLPYRFLVDAVRLTEKKIGARLSIVGTASHEGEMNVFQNLDVHAILLHGATTDTRSERRVRSFIDAVRETGSMTGLATHQPLSTLRWLLGKGFDLDLLMIPFNMMGYLMDSVPEEVIKTAAELGKPMIAKKTLGAGRLDPEEALRYVSKFKCIHGVAIGVASEEEAKETLSLATQLFR